MLNEILVARSFSFVFFLLYRGVESLFSFSGSFLCTSQLTECDEANSRRPFYKQAKSPSQFPTIPGECCKANSCGRFFDTIAEDPSTNNSTFRLRIHPRQVNAGTRWNMNGMIEMYLKIYNCMLSNNHQAYLEG